MEKERYCSDSKVRHASDVIQSRIYKPSVGHWFIYKQGISVGYPIMLNNFLHNFQPVSFTQHTSKFQKKKYIYIHMYS